MPWGWVQFVPVVLSIPLWFVTLRLAYRNSVKPTTFVDPLITGCRLLLDRAALDIEESKKAGKKESRMTLFACVCTNYVLDRYGDEKVSTKVQLETLLTFSACLVVAFSASCVVWALVGRTAVVFDPLFLQPYAFFTTYSFPEYLLWAFGCMTTSISFPGAGASVSLKSLHAMLLITGVFHLTFLLVGFSVMALAEGQRVVKKTEPRLDDLKKSRDQLLIKNANLANNAITVTATVVPSGPDKEPPAH
jgi:hypothetical protein